jgi:predicted kinase
MYALAARIADFHRRAVDGAATSKFGRFEVVAGNAIENIAQTAGHVGLTVSPAVHRRVDDLTRRELERLRPLIEERAARRVPRDTHGDLHLDHIYYFPDRTPPDDFVVIDCIEFNERFRFADPVADAAFVFMDLLHEGRRDLADAFAEAYFRASGDAVGKDLLPFYAAYRSVVRAKVSGMKAVEPEVPAEEKAAAVARARAHWLLPLSILEEPARRPCLILVGGLPGAGKSTLSRTLADPGGFDVVRSDVVRKELAGLAPSQSAKAPFGEGIYSPEWTERTYAECLARAERLLFEGRRVAVDASFGDDSLRERFLDAAARWGVPVLFFHCLADPAAVWSRLQCPRENDASDADWCVYTQAAGQWQEPGPAVKPVLRFIDTGGNADAAGHRVLDELRHAGLY